MNVGHSDPPPLKKKDMMTSQQEGQIGKKPDLSKNLFKKFQNPLIKPKNVSEIFIRKVFFNYYGMTTEPCVIV